MIGILALLTGKTSEIITISVFGALTLYILSMISLLALRKKEPLLSRPFKVPAYPVFPIIALVIAIISFVAMAVYNFKLALFYTALVTGCYLLFRILRAREI